MNEYMDAVREMLDLMGLDATNEANHAALETGLISVEMFQAAARILAAAFLAG